MSRRPDNIRPDNSFARPGDRLKLIRPYWPTLVVGILVGLVALMLDDLNRELRREQARDMVAFELETVRSRLDRHLTDATEVGRHLAGRLERLDAIGPRTFEEIGGPLFPSVSGSSCVAWAPDLIVAAAFRPPDWETIIGLDLRETSNHGSRLEHALLDGDIVSEGPGLGRDGRVMLVQMIPVKQGAGAGEVLRGAVSVGVSLGHSLSEIFADSPSSHIDVAIAVRGESGGPEHVVLGPQDIFSQNPEFARVITPGGGEFTLLAVPRSGWNSGSTGSTAVRLSLFGTCLLIVGMTLHSNRLSMRRREATLAREAAEGRLWGVVQNLPGAAYTYTMPPGREVPGPEDRITFVNKDACQEIWGLPAADVEADSMEIARLVDDPSALGEIAVRIRDSVRLLQPWHAVWPIRTPQGQRKWLDGRGHPVRLADGSTVWFSMIVDATRQVEQEQDLERQKELSHQAQKQQSIGQLTGGVAHDFNNLLAVIMGNLELLRDEETLPERIQLIDAGIKAARRGADLTRSMLAFARKARLEPRPIDLNSLVTETRNWAGRTLPENIEVETVLLPGLWMIEADPASTEAALLNLIVNARDAMPRGGKLTIATANVRIDRPDTDARQSDIQPGRYVVLAVTDTGHGIPAEHLSRVFDPFFTTKPPSSGSGLGLSMTQGFMEQSGGAVKVYSEPGQGTTFRLYFPAGDCAAEATGPETAETCTHADIGRHVLLVEDEDDVRSVLARTVRSGGYRVTEAGSGDEALAVFKADPTFDLLVTDIVMPGALQGTGLSRVVREMRPDLPVVFMSGYAGENIVHGNLLRPEDIRLMKPVQRADLLNALSRAIRHSSPPEGKTTEPRFS